jgi:hypothetical protein
MGDQFRQYFITFCQNIGNGVVGLGNCLIAAISAASGRRLLQKVSKEGVMMTSMRIEKKFQNLATLNLMHFL